MPFSPRIEALIESLCCLPGVGRKTAQRMALHLLERNRQGGHNLANHLEDALINVTRCQLCRNHSETDWCHLCTSSTRDSTQLCIVETPADVAAIDQATGYKGLYFVLMGHLSPLDGIGPEQLGLPALFVRIGQTDTIQVPFSNAALQQVKEVIVATNPTVEGDATAYYIHEHIRSLKLDAVHVSRIAHGVPVGGELEYVDRGTLAHAFAGRKVW